MIPVPYCKRTRCAITVPFSERKSESTFRQEFMLAVLWLGSKFGKDLSYNHEVPVSTLYVMFEGLLDTVINETLIVSFAEQLDDEEFDPELCLSSCRLLLNLKDQKILSRKVYMEQSVICLLKISR